MDHRQDPEAAARSSEPWFFDENPAVSKFASEPRAFDSEARLESFFFRSPCPREVNNRANETFMRMLRKEWADLSPSRRSAVHSQNSTREGIQQSYTPGSWRASAASYSEKHSQKLQEISSETSTHLPGQPVGSSSGVGKNPKVKPLSTTIGKSLRFEPGTSVPKRILSPGRLPKYLRKLKSSAHGAGINPANRSAGNTSQVEEFYVVRDASELLNRNQNVQPRGFPKKSDVTVKSALKHRSAFDSPSKASAKRKGISWEVPVSDANSPEGSSPKLEVKVPSQEDHEKLVNEIKQYLEEKQREISAKDPHCSCVKPGAKTKPDAGSPSPKDINLHGIHGNSAGSKLFSSQILAEAHMRGSRIPVLAAHFQPHHVNHGCLEDSAGSSMFMDHHPAHPDQHHNSSGNVSSHDSGFSESATDYQQPTTSTRKRVISKKKSPTRRASARTKFGVSNRRTAASSGLGNNRADDGSASRDPRSKLSRGSSNADKSKPPRPKVLRDVQSPIAARRKGHKELDKRREAARNIFNWFVYRWNVMPALRREQVELFNDAEERSSLPSTSDGGSPNQDNKRCSSHTQDPKVDVIVERMKEIRLQTPPRPYSVAVTGRTEVIATELSSHFARDWLRVEDSLNSAMAFQLNSDQESKSENSQKNKQKGKAKSPKKTVPISSKIEEKSSSELERLVSEPRKPSSATSRKEKSVQCHLDSSNSLMKVPNLLLKRHFRPLGSCHSAPSCAPDGEMVPDWDASIGTRNSAGSQTDAYLLEHSMYSQIFAIHHANHDDADADISGSVSLENIPEDINSASTWDLDSQQSLLSSFNGSNSDHRNASEDSVEDLFEIRVSRKKRGYLDLSQISSSVANQNRPLPIITHPVVHQRSSNKSEYRQSTQYLVVAKEGETIGLPSLTASNEGGRQKLSDCVDLTVQKAPDDGIQLNIHSLPDICMHLTISPVASKAIGRPESPRKKFGDRSLELPGGRRQRFSSFDGTVSGSNDGAAIGWQPQRALPASALPGGMSNSKSSKQKHLSARLLLTGDGDSGQRNEDNNASTQDGLPRPPDIGDGTYPTALWIRKVNIMRKKPKKVSK